MQYKKFIFFSLYVYSLLLFQCGKNELYFNVNPSLLGELFSNDKIGINLRVPKGWKKISQKELLLVKKKLNEKNIEGIIPLQFYVDKNEGSMCIISTFEKNKRIKRIVSEYKVRLKKYFSTSKITYTSFYKDDIKFYQFQIITEKFINIKLFLLSKYKNIIQIDYIVPSIIYNDKLKSIESSIGSIKI